MKPRYAIGSGKAPAHLAWINRQRGSRGELVFSGGDCGERRIPYESESELLELLRKLIAERVPLSVGGHAVGAADQVENLSDAGTLSRPYVEIAWSGPNQWTVREIMSGAREWEQVTAPDMIANITFSADALKRVG